MKNKPTTTVKLILGALMCQGLFTIFIFLKYAPTALFPNMPFWLLLLPLWLPIVIYLIMVTHFILTFISDDTDRKPYK